MSKILIVGGVIGNEGRRKWRGTLPPKQKPSVSSSTHYQQKPRGHMTKDERNRLRNLEQDYHRSKEFLEYVTVDSELHRYFQSRVNSAAFRFRANLIIRKNRREGIDQEANA